jgi:hypothetical protein
MMSLACDRSRRDGAPAAPAAATVFGSARVASLVALALALGCSGNINEGGSGPGPGMGGVPGNSAGGSGPGAGGAGAAGGNRMMPPGGTGGSGPGGTGMTTPPMTYDANSGHTPMRRLTRTQYDNSVRDLLGVAGDPAGNFGIDEEDTGFASNNHAPLTDLQLEKYQQAADTIAGNAVANVGSLLQCAPAATEDVCVEAFITSFGKRALRRPLTAAEVTRYKALFASGKTGGDLASGISLVISAFLQSPYFLYRVELGDPKAPGATKDLIPLSQYEIGTRLSYFLTDSTPDVSLLAAADAGKLGTPEGIAAEAQRLITSPKARDTLVSFYQQWLGVEDLLTVEKDPKAYALYNPTVRSAMRDEVLEFVDEVTRLGDGKLLTLLTSHTTWIRGPLYPLYGLGMQGAAGGSILHKVDMPADQRSGVLTLPGVLAEYGHADQSSPIGRGKLVSERLLCIVPPDPPPGVAANVPPPDPTVPTRVRFEKHRTDPMCSACHALMDPLGVTFENYDGVGTYRTMDGGKVVDAASALTGTKASDGPVKNAVELLAKLSTAEETHSCFARQMFRYAFGRAEQDFDKGMVGDIQAALGKTDRIPDLMVAIATAPGFRTRIPVDLR